MGGCEKCICKSDTYCIHEGMEQSNHQKGEQKWSIPYPMPLRVPIPPIWMRLKKRQVSVCAFALRIVGIGSTVWHVHYHSIKLRSTRYCSWVIMLKLD